MNKIVRFSNRFGFENGRVLSIGWVESRICSFEQFRKIRSKFLDFNINYIDNPKGLKTKFQHFEGTLSDVPIMLLSYLGSLTLSVGSLKIVIGVNRI